MFSKIFCHFFSFYFLLLARFIHSYTLSHSELDISSNSDRFAVLENELYQSEHNHLKFLNEEDSECELRSHASKKDYYYFLPELSANLKKENAKVEFSSLCFKKNSAELVKFTKEETVIEIESSDPKSLFCSDSLWISTSNIQHIVKIFRHGKHTVKLKNLTDDDMAEIKVNGIKVLGFCQGFWTELKSFFLSLRLYIGGLGQNTHSVLPVLRPEVPKYMEDANIDFLTRYTNWKPISRGEYGNKVLSIDESEIKSGDFLAIYRLDGLDPLIMFGTGSHVGHSAVACWIDGELYVLESQDGWYWPKRGIQRNKWTQWVEWAHNADFNVAVLPLKDEVRASFDVEKALKWFSGVEGLNYGYRNFLFGWIDTKDQNLPKLIDPVILLSIFSILEKVSKSTADTIMTEALNQRLGVKGYSIPQITAEAARRNLSFEEVIALPEIDGWVYSDGVNYVCSSLVIGFYKAGGIFGDLDLNATEFTPKDVYQIDIFDKTYKDRRPQMCKDADPDLEYCQVMGRYKVTLTNYSTIHPYAHMNEKCPSMCPDYIRPDNC